MEGDKEIREPYQLFGIECGDGWGCLYEPIIDYINNYNEDKEDEDKICVLQIKEKFGQLRIYVSHMTDELSKMIDDAEEKSAYICEECGSDKNVGMVIGSWYYTVCFGCLRKEAMKKGIPILWKSNDDNEMYWVKPDGGVEKFKGELP